MPQLVLIRKIRSAKYRANECWRRWQSAKEAKKRKGAFDYWINGIRSKPPEVWVGSNFVEFGGTRHHMHALEKFTSLNLKLAPDDDTMSVLSPDHFKLDFHQQFMDFKPTGVRAVHSHVFPWFVDWCHRYKTRTMRWIHTHHNWYYPEFGKGKLEPWQTELNKTFIFALSHADVCLSVSRWQQAYLKETHGIETHYLPNGVDVELCDQSNADRFRSQNGISNFILWAGRNDPVKNPADFVRLAMRLPDQRFLMIGHGLNREVLENEWEVEPPSNLTIRGEATHCETLDAIAACSVSVVTSKREGLPTLVMEGMAHSKSVVVPDEDGCMEPVNGGECGFVYKKGDMDHLAAVTLKAVADTKLGTHARQRVMEEYDWRIIIKKLDAIYHGADSP